MLTKLLFTGLVIAVVFALYRVRSRVGTARPSGDRDTAVATSSRLGRALSYALVVVLLMISGVAYYFHWRAEQQLVSVRVIDTGTGHVTSYRAYQRSIEGKRFRAADGRTVVIGDSERLEILAAD